MAPHPCLFNILNDDGQSPLHLAVLTRQPRIVRRLILAGASPALRNFRGNTALHLTCATGDLASAKALTDPLSPVERNYLLPGKKIPALPQNLEQRNYDGRRMIYAFIASSIRRRFFKSDRCSADWVDPGPSPFISVQDRGC